MSGKTGDELIKEALMSSEGRDELARAMSLPLKIWLGYKECPVCKERFEDIMRHCDAVGDGPHSVVKVMLS